MDVTWALLKTEHSNYWMKVETPQLNGNTNSLYFFPRESYAPNPLTIDELEQREMQQLHLMCVIVSLCTMESFLFRKYLTQYKHLYIFFCLQIN